MIFVRVLLVVASLFIGSFSFADQVYTHPSGVQFRYPDGWSIRDSAYADFEIVPADADSDPSGTMETYFQWTFLFEPSEEKITQNLELLIPRVVPFLKRAGEIEHLQNPKGMMLSWNGKSEDGQDVWARVFVIPGKDM